MAALVDTAEELVIEKTAETGKPEAKLIHVGLKDVSLDYITYNAKVSVTNPYTIPIPISEISYTLKTANRDIASGSTPDLRGSLKGNDTVVLDVELEVPHSVLLSFAKDIAADLDIDYELGINFVLNFHIDYELAHLEDLAEKYATEKSDTAREAFLAKLALDSKKAHNFFTIITVSHALLVLFPLALSYGHPNACRSYCGNLTIDHPFALRSSCGHPGFRDLLICINDVLMFHISSGSYRD
ncbi:hypothetical protein AgCh_016501 [Apium graveolens]